MKAGHVTLELEVWTTVDEMDTAIKCIYSFWLHINYMRLMLISFYIQLEFRTHVHTVYSVSFLTWFPRGNCWRYVGCEGRSTTVDFTIGKELRGYLQTTIRYWSKCNYVLQMRQDKSDLPSLCASPFARCEAAGTQSTIYRVCNRQVELLTVIESRVL